MDWKTLLVIAVVVVVIIIVKKAGQVSADDARGMLGKGAAVIDVRSPGEFQSGHLPQAVNIPLDLIETDLPRQYPDKGQVLLLHCASGMRSSVAARKLKALGYANAHNLGSYQRAAGIVGSR
ncbi:MAG: rhodanese-like domain-containing protein [Verrucomicrobiae bacterium]|nr:rhodanese-like domain-containing protein [Verrucomicrobiae bacterium]MCP5532594.1 rhodanese-like domain-containing protein [Akkermansiaceae bacterium]MCP5544715.1 rhodanese-like domain-containing protein [Akkermansiaceae bacterium]MCP5545855.1 rhodanese-like domain-containing protein [Akkermansiaceae bacterium]